MDNVETSVSNLKISSVALTKKQSPGTRGIPTEIKTNLVKLGLTKNIPIFKYDCRIYVVFVTNDGVEKLMELTKQTREDYTEQERKGSTVHIYTRLLKDYADFFGNSVSLYYDRAAVLFSLKKLNIKTDKTFNLAKDYISGYEKSNGFRVTIKPVNDCFQVTTNDLEKVVQSRPEEADRTLLEALNLIAGQLPLLNTQQFITYGNGTHYLYTPDTKHFSHADLPALPDGKYIGIGCNKSVKVLGDSVKDAAPFATIEVKKTAFHNDDQPLLDKIGSLSVFGRQRFNIDMLKDTRTLKQITDLLKNLSVMTTYGNKKQVFPFAGFAKENALTSKHEYNGKIITTVQYYKEKYEIILKYPQLPLVFGRVGRQFRGYPLEILKVAKNQRVIGSQQTPEQIAKMGVSNPSDRQRQTNAMKDSIGLHSTNGYMKEAGIVAANDFTITKARILPSPTISYGENKVVPADKNCKWSIQGKFAFPIALNKWTVVCLLQKDSPPESMLREYIKRLIDMAKSKGMNVAAPAGFEFITNPNEGNVKLALQRALALGFQMVFFMSADRVTLHNFIKKEEVCLQILTQEVKLSKVVSVIEKRQNQTLENIAMKINSKLGGLAKVVHLSDNVKTRAWLNDAGRLFIGFEFSHPAPLLKWEIDRGDTYKTPSVIGFGANCGTLPQYFLGDFKYVAPHQPEALEDELQDIFDSLIRKFRENRKIPPNHLVVFFNGVSEGQFSLVAGNYLKKIRATCSKISEQYKPKMTLIAVMKAHNERFYNKIISGNNATEQNIPAGVVVDQTIVNPTVTEFFLNAHCAFKGTAKTPKYSVLYDDTNMPSDVVQGMTHGLCFMHDIVNSTVSIPIPLLVADRMAKRGTSNYSELNGSEGGAIDIKRANEQLTYKGKKLSNQRFNA